MTSPPFHSLREPMDTAFGKACLVGNPAHTLCTVLPKTVENPQTFGPKCHVGQCSERVTELLLEFSPSAYLTDAPLSRHTRIPTQSMISMIEKGARGSEMSLDTAWRLAWSLGTSLDWLAGMPVMRG